MEKIQAIFVKTLIQIRLFCEEYLLDYYPILPSEADWHTFLIGMLPIYFMIISMIGLALSAYLKSSYFLVATSIALLIFIIFYCLVLPFILQMFLGKNMMMQNGQK